MNTSTDKEKNLPDQIIPDRAEPELVLDAKDVSHQYGRSNFHLKPLDIQLHAGEITAIVGENGSGKSTLIKLLAGELLSHSGSIAYPSFQQKPPSWQDIKQQTAYIPQRIRSWSGKVKDYLHFTASIKNIRGQANEHEVDYIIHRLGLGRYADQNWESLSGGYQMRFELARMLVWKPKLLILDEPLANLDINATQVFLRDLSQLAKSFSHPIAVLITSQHLYETEGISDRLLFLKNGEAIYQGRPDEIGKESATNAFELQVENSQAELEGILLPYGITDLSSSGNNLIIRTSKEIDARHMMRILAEDKHHIQVRYFRDISDSTRTLFAS